MRLAFVVALLVASLAAFAPLAQEETQPTTLLADKVTYLKDQDLLIAEGNVRVRVEGREIQADRIIYDNASGDIRTEGASRIVEADGSILLTGETALTEAAETGLIYGARLLLAENFQFAAVEARRQDSRYTTLYKAVGSSCQVCANKPIPLWLIRAEEVVRDELEQQIYLKNAEFDLAGQTIAFIPYFRMADPAVRRATGFLNPSFSSSNIYGSALRFPYYIVTSASSDVTLTPFITTIGAVVLEGEYRQRFSNGDLTMNGSLALDDGRGEQFERGHLFVDGRFDLGDDFVLSLDLKRPSDRSYLGRFGYSTTDRLESDITLTRQRPREYLSFAAIGYQSLREDEDDADLPNALPEFRYRSFLAPGDIPGQLGVSGDAVHLFRVDGQDVVKLNAGLDWRAEQVLPGGLIGTGFAGVSARAYSVQDAGARNTEYSRLAYREAGVGLRWPLARQDTGALHVIEPVAEAVYSETSGADPDRVPNEDSTNVEFDVTNLFALNRYPGTDRQETGWRLNLGAHYSRIDATGWEMDLSLGRVIRPEAIDGFPENTGLNGIRSNVVAGASFDLPPHLRLSSQTLFDDDFGFSRNDLQAALDVDPFKLDLSYVYLAEDPSAGAPDRREEFTLSGAYQINRHWSFDASWRRNLAEDRNVQAELGLTFINECIQSRFSASRRFTTSDTVPSAIEYDLTIDLAGLGGSSQGQASGCVDY